ncbi:MAG: hypothetical protein ABL898_14680 [Hyphomicrobiaceae bacterium]
MLEDVIADDDVEGVVGEGDLGDVDGGVGVAPLLDVAADVARFVFEFAKERPFRRDVEDFFILEIDVIGLKLDGDLAVARAALAIGAAMIDGAAFARCDEEALVVAAGARAFCARAEMLHGIAQCAACPLFS